MTHTPILTRAEQTARDDAAARPWQVQEHPMTDDYIATTGERWIYAEKRVCKTKGEVLRRE